MSVKDDKLQDVYDTAEDFRVAQQNVGKARERFVDAIMEAKNAKATQQEIAQRCVIEPNSSKHLSRQRVAQFIGERKRQNV